MLNSRLLCRMLILAMVALGLLAPWAGLAYDQEPGPRPVAVPQDDTFASYLQKLAVIRTESWFQRELRKFKTFRYLDRAYRLMAQNRLQEASIELEKYLVADPDDQKIRSTLMIVRYKMGNMPGVAEAAGRILEKDKGFVPALIYRGLAEQSSGALDQAAGSFAAAAAAAGVMLSDRILALNMLSDLYLRQKAYREAADALQALSELEQDASVFLRRAIALEALQRLPEALDAFRRAAVATPARAEDHALALGMLADAAIRQGLYKLALEPAREVTEYDCSFAAWFRLGTVLEKTGLPAEAANAYRAAVTATSDPKAQIQGYRALAEIAKRRKQWQEAYNADLAALKLSGENPDIQSDLGRICHAWARYTEGLKWTRKALAMRPTRANRELLATLLFATQDYAGAIDVWKSLLKETGEGAERRRILVNLGNACIANGDYESGYAALSEAMSLRGNADIAEVMGESLVKLSRTEEAVMAYRRALELDPTPARHLKLATLLAQRGNTDEALMHLEKALQGDWLPIERSAILNQMGFLYSRAGRDAEARRAFETALAAGGPNAGTEAALGETCLKMGAYEDAMIHLGRALETPENPALLRSLAQAEALAGKTEHSIATYKRALGAMTGDSADAMEIRVSIANLNAKLGRYAEAAARYAEAYRLGGLVSWNMLVRAAECLALATDWPSAADMNRKLLALPELPARERGAAFERLGFALVQAGQPRPAADAFREALAFGGNQTELRLNLGYALIASGERDEAIRQFLKILETSRTARHLSTLGQLYVETHKPGLAIYYFEEAALASAELDASEQRNLWMVLGQLYAGEYAYERAIEAWSRAQRMDAKPSTALALARLERLAGRRAEAYARLDKIDASSLNSAEQAERWDEVAALSRADLAYTRTVEALWNANRIEPRAARYYQIGLNLSDLGQLDAAIESLEEAVAREPENIRYVEALGYACRRAGRLEDAARLLESVVKADPDYLRTYEDLAYIEMERSRNEAAAGWFQKAIDNAPFRPIHTPDEEEKLRVDVVRMRGEVSRLTERFTADFYLTPSFGNRRLASVPGGTGGGVLPAQGGVDVVYQPPSIGLRNGRVFQVFGRVLWSLTPGTFEFQPESFQGGVGVRYKPLRRQNIFVSAERLFEIGDRSENNWLLRTMYSWACGFYPDVDRCARNYTTFYFDAAYFAQNPRRGALFGEARQGITFTPVSRVRVTPHLMADLRYENPGLLTGSYAEAGGGLSIKYIPAGGHYERSRMSFEFIAHYRLGRFIKDASAISENHTFSGWVLTFLTLF